MDQQGGNSDLTFTASIQDNVSATADQIEKKLKALGATKTEIKMTMTAIDQASKQAKQVQDTINKLPKTVMINVKSNVDTAQKSMDKLKEAIKAPLTLTIHVKDDMDTYVRNLKSRAASMEQQLKQQLRGTPLVAGILGQSGQMMTSTGFSTIGSLTNLPLSGVGAGAGAAGITASLGAFFSQSMQLNSQMQQNMVSLTTLLRSPSGAQSELRNVSNFSMQTPFQMQDVLQSDIRLRSIGINPNNPVIGLRPASNLASGTGSNLSQATGALTSANLGYFQSLNNLTGRNITQQDFTYGGRYQGQTYQQAITGILKQYQGASQAQMETFKGLASNIQDVISQRFTNPVGSGMFTAAQGGEKSLANTLGSTGFQTQMADVVGRLQDGITRLFQTLSQGKTYFQTSLQQPLENILQNVASVGKSFASSFGGTVIQGIKYTAEALTTVLQPLTAIAAKFPVLGQAAGFLKGLQVIGLGGPTGIKSIAGGVTSLNPMEVMRGVGQAAGTVGKLGLFEAAKYILDMKNANDQLTNSFKNLGQEGGSSLDSLKAKFDTLMVSAAMMGQSVSSIKSAGADFGQNTFKQVTGGAHNSSTLRNLMWYGGTGSASLAYNLGTSTSKASQMLSSTFNQEGLGSQVSNGMGVQAAVQQAEGDIIQAAKNLAKATGDTMAQAAQIIQTASTMWASQLSATHTATPMGAGFAAMLNQNLKGTADYGKYATFPGGLVGSLMSSYVSPGIPVLQNALKHGLNKSFTFNSNLPNVNSQTDPYSLTSTASTADIISNLQGYRNAASSGRAYTRSMASQLANGSGNSQVSAILQQYGRLPSMGNTLGGLGLGNLPNMTASQVQGMSPTQDAQAMVKLDAAANSVNTKMQTLNQTMTKYQMQLDEISAAEEQVQGKLASVTNSMAGQQDTIDHLQLSAQNFTDKAINPLNVAMTQLSMTMAAYQQNQAVPVQRAQDALNESMATTAQAVNTVNYNLQQAQYNLDKFGSGLLTGEQAALNNIQALTVYGQKLQLFQLMNQGIGIDLTKSVLKGGFAETVSPLAGFDLAAQQAAASRASQIAQLKYDTTYGNQHWKLQQAQRTEWQRTEMPFNERMKGVKGAVGVIDASNLTAHQLATVQYQQQTVAYDLQKKSYDITVGAYAMQDKQYKLNQQMSADQIISQKYQERIANASETIAAKLLPYQEATTYAGNVATIQSAKLTPKMNLIQDRLGALQDVIPVLRELGGDFGKNFNKDITKGQGALDKNLPNIARDMGLSKTALQEILKTLHGPTGTSGSRRGGSGRNPSSPGLVHDLTHPWNFLSINPLTTATNAYDYARNKLGSLGVPGGIAVPVAGAAGLTVGVGFTNALSVAMTHTMAKLFGGEKPIVGRIPFVSAQIDKDLTAAPWSRILKPWSYARGLTSEFAGAGAAHAITEVGMHAVGLGGISTLPSLIAAWFGRQAGGRVGERSGPWIPSIIRAHGNPIRIGRNIINSFGEHGSATAEDINNKVLKVLVQDPARVGGDTSGALKWSDVFSQALQSAKSFFTDTVHTAAPITEDEPVASRAGRVVRATASRVRSGAGRAVQAVKKFGADDSGELDLSKFISEDGKVADTLSKAGDLFSKATKTSSDGSSLLESASKVFSKAGDMFGDDRGKFGAAVVVFGGAIDLFKGIPNAFGTAISKIPKAFSDAFSKIGDVFDPIIKAFTKAGDLFTSAATSIGSKIKDFTEPLTSFFKDLSKGKSVAKAAGDVADAADAANTAGKVVKALSKLSDLPGVKLAGKTFKFAGDVGAVLQAAPDTIDAVKNFQQGGTLGVGKGLNDVAGAGLSVASLGTLNLGNWLATKLGISSGGFDLGKMLNSGSGPASASNAQLSQFVKLSQSLGNQVSTGSVMGQATSTANATGIQNTLAQVMKLTQVQPGSSYGAQLLAYLVNSPTIGGDNQNGAKVLVTAYNNLVNHLSATKQLTTQSQTTAEQAETTHQANLTKAIAAGGASQYAAIKTAADQLGQHSSGFWAQMTKLVASGAEGQATAAIAGYLGIGKAQSQALDELGKQITDWADSMGIPLTDSKGGKGKKSSGSFSLPSNIHIQVAGGGSAPQFASGGLVDADKHRVGMDRGRMVRMVEEGHSEVVIPLAPHRRDRARSLLSQTASMIGMAAGGHIQPTPGDAIDRGGVGGGPNTPLTNAPPGGAHLASIISAANQLNARGLPYLYGGGHTQPASLDPKGMDCSATVSYVVQHGGYGVNTTTAQNVGSWGFPTGPGKVSIYYRGGAEGTAHTFMDILGHFFGTSGFARPNGGPGWFTEAPGAGYLDQFSVVHLPDLGSAGGQKIGGPSSGFSSIVGGSAGGSGGGSPLHLKLPEAAKSALAKGGIMGGYVYAALAHAAKAGNKHFAGMAGSASGLGGGGLGGLVKYSGAKGSAAQTHSVGWVKDLLKTLGAPETALNIKSVSEWITREGNLPGVDTFNPLDTTQAGYGGVSTNSVHVRAYPSWGGGIAATVQTLRNGLYPNIVKGLMSGKGLPQGGSASSELLSWSGGGYSGYAGGISHVARDNTPAILHQGEAVLTAAQNNALKGGSNPLLTPINLMVAEIQKLRKSSEIHFNNSEGNGKAMQAALADIDGLTKTMSSTQRQQMLNQMMSNVKNLGVSFSPTHSALSDTGSSPADRALASVIGKLEQTKGGDKSIFNLPALQSDLNTQLGLVQKYQKQLADLSKQLPKQFTTELAHVSGAIADTKAGLAPLFKALGVKVGNVTGAINEEKAMLSKLDKPIVNEIDKLSKAMSSQKGAPTKAPAELKQIAADLKKGTPTSDKAAQKLINELNKQIKSDGSLSKAAKAKDEKQLQAIQSAVTKSDKNREKDEKNLSALTRLKDLEDLKKQMSSSGKISEKQMEQLMKLVTPKSSFEKEFAKTEKALDDAKSKASSDSADIKKIMNEYAAWCQKNGVGKQLEALTLKQIENGGVSITNDKQMIAMTQKLSAQMGSGNTDRNKNHADSQAVRKANHAETVALKKAAQAKADYNHGQSQTRVTAKDTRDTGFQTKVLQNHNLMTTGITAVETAIKKLELNVNNNVSVNTSGSKPTVTVSSTKIPQNG